MIIVAIGFDALTGALTAINPENGEGEHLADMWKNGVRTYLGFGVSGFPNMFLRRASRASLPGEPPTARAPAEHLPGACRSRTISNAME